MSNPQGIVVGKGSAISGARGPPTRRGINDYLFVNTLGVEDL